MTNLTLPITAMLAIVGLPHSVGADVTITKGDGKVIVKIDGEHFTDYVYEGHSKPIFYPIIGPEGIEMTRHYPMKKDVDNEARDHPHHKSLWFTHDDVNGVHFWMEYPGDNSDLRPGRAVQKELHIEGSSIRVNNEWRDPDGKVVLTDTRDLSFGTTSAGRYIDIAVTVHASHGEVKFGDTKEGTMGIRTHPQLRLKTDERRGNHTANGHAVNSEGVEGKAMWGKRAKWVDYWGEINGATVGIAIFDHPSNPRHPTWWHARDYGLIAANPFGVHDFESKPAGTGDMVIPAGESATFRYRFLFHRGDVNGANVSGEYASFAK
jgi:hypothetical protein